MKGLNMIRSVIVAILFTISLSSIASAQHWHGGGGGWHGGGGGGWHGGGGFHGGGFHGGGFHGGGFHGHGWGGPAIGLGLGALGAYGAYEYTRPCPYGYFLAEDGVCYPSGY